MTRRTVAIHDAIERSWIRRRVHRTGGDGIQPRLRQLARDQFIDGGINRVILATDGDFNVGITSREPSSWSLIEEKAQESGVFLTVLGFGTGNLTRTPDRESWPTRATATTPTSTTTGEARKVLVDEIGANLVTVAKDVKIQVEFNPRQGREPIG